MSWANEWRVESCVTFQGGVGPKRICIRVTECRTPERPRNRVLDLDCGARSPLVTPQR